MKILKLLNKSNFLIIIIFFLSSVCVVSENKPIDIWNLDKQKNELNNELNLLEEKKIDLIVLAGFTLKIPLKLVKKYERRIINLHPSLLPKFGGKGMYGDKVHIAVLKSKERFTGITIHYVDEVYDNGEVIFQKRCSLDLNESVVSLREKIRIMEYEFFPKTIEKLLN